MQHNKKTFFKGCLGELKVIKDVNSISQRITLDASGNNLLGIFVFRVTGKVMANQLFGRYFAPIFFAHQFN
ncbi:MAG: hypothetical protein C0490_17325 [Marivirga sp.]|nr:hypothetical protein [Marivirga sp.]